MSDKLMVVAHPDDESIFGGAQLIIEPGWKVVCVTNGDNLVRSFEFANAMKWVNAEYEIWSYKDGWDVDLYYIQLVRDLEKLLSANHYRKIVTHNLEGEYGHVQHKSLSYIMHSIVKRNLYVFSQGERELPARLLKMKQQLLRAYVSQSQVPNLLHLEKYITNESIVRVK